MPLSLDSWRRECARYSVFLGLSLDCVVLVWSAVGRVGHVERGLLSVWGMIAIGLFGWLSIGACLGVLALVLGTVQRRFESRGLAGLVLCTAGIAALPWLSRA